MMLEDLCIRERCTEFAYHRGLCRRHYDGWRREGQPEGGALPPKRAGHPRSHPAEARRRAVAAMHEGVTAADAAIRFGVSERQLYRWRKEAERGEGTCKS